MTSIGGFSLALEELILGTAILVPGTTPAFEHSPLEIYIRRSSGADANCCGRWGMACETGRGAIPHMLALPCAVVCWRQHVAQEKTAVTHSLVVLQESRSKSIANRKAEVGGEFFILLRRNFERSTSNGVFFSTKTSQYTIHPCIRL